MKKQIILRSLTFLGIASYVLALFTNIWQFQIDGEIVGEYGLIATFPSDIAEAFTLGGETFSTLGATLVSIFTFVGLVALCLVALFSILNWLKVFKEKYNKIILIISVLLVFVSAVGIFVGGTLFTMQSASIQIPFTSTYFDAFMVASNYFYVLVIGSIWSTIFGLISLKNFTNKNK